MRKLILSLALGVGFITANAIPLFPFFTDVAGDYKDGSPEVFNALQMPCMYWQKPTFFSNLKDADAFLNDVIPYSTESISRSVKELDGGITVVTYTSPMANGQTSVIYLLDIPKEGFLIGYNELGK